MLSYLIERTMEILIDSNLKAFMEELKEVKAKIKELEQEKINIMYMIESEMGDNEIIMGEDGLIIATYKKSSRSYLDSKGLETSYPDIWKRFLKTSEVRTFLIKE